MKTKGGGRWNVLGFSLVYGAKAQMHCLYNKFLGFVFHVPRIRFAVCERGRSSPLVFILFVFLKAKATHVLSPRLRLPESHLQPLLSVTTQGGDLKGIVSF